LKFPQLPKPIKAGLSNRKSIVQKRRKTMNHKRYSRITHSISIISLILVLALQYTALPGLSNIQLASAANGQTGISNDWLAQAQEYIRQSEYNISWTDQPLVAGAPASYQAPNRAQDLRIYFQERGLQIIPRTEAEPTWVWGMALNSYGRGVQFTAVEQPALNVAGSQIAYQRQALSEVYTNHELGLLQTFHLDARPGQEQEPLVLRLSLTGDLTAHAQVGGGFEFRHNSLAVLSYGNLKAKDANGRSLLVEARLDASLNAAGEPTTELQLEIDDQQADYPLTIDATLIGFSSTPAWAVMGQQNNALYSSSVATAGDVNGDGYSDILIGIPYYDYNYQDAGAVFLYFGSSSGPSTYANWAGTGFHGGDHFGASVATAGDVNGDDFSDIIIGAPSYFDLGGSDVGIVYVYHGSIYGPSSSPDWTHAGSQIWAAYGSSVATAGDINGDGYSDVIVGAPRYDDQSANPEDVGRVYIYHGSASGLAANHAWSTLGTWYSYLGYSVATAGDVNNDGYADVIIGAPGRDTGLEAASNGAAYLYYGSASGINNTIHERFDGRDLYGQFGYSVSTAGDVNGDGCADVIIGAPKADTFDGDLEKGEVHVFYGGSPRMDGNPDWMVLTYQDYSNLGNSVATAGDVNSDGYADIIIGQKKYDGSGGQTDLGRALVWLGSSGGLPGSWRWDDQADWIIYYATASSQFGYSVATAGDVNGDGYSDVLIGAPYYQTSGETRGMAVVFYGAANNLTHTPGWTYRGNYEDINLGYSVASAGDINGDGYADIIAGAPYYDSTYADQGAVFVWHGSTTGLNSIADWWALGDTADGRFGYSVDTAGDVNGDGYSDIIVGAPNYDAGIAERGMTFVWLGSAAGLGNQGSPGNADWKTWGWFGVFSVPEMGTVVASAGDVNGDGYGDVAIGTPKYQSNAGQVMVWQGGPSGLGDNSRIPDWYTPGYPNWSLGISVAGAGDVNRDGYSDLIAGGANLTAVWHGSASGLSTSSYDWIRSGSGSFGWSVDTAGDINGDGYSDVIVGAPLYTSSYNQEGLAMAYCGSASGLNTSACWMDLGWAANAWLGWSVSGAGDVNGDGYADILVGAPAVSNPTSFEGQARLYYGSNAGPISLNNGDWLHESSTDSAFLGWSVSSAGDVNGDGYADVLVGASGMSSARGEVQLFYGNGAPGKSWRPRQFRSDCSTPVHNLGSIGPNIFLCMQITALDPMGWGKFGIVTELKTLQEPFDGIAYAGYWYNMRTAATENRIVGLDEDQHHHWRIRIMHSPVTSPFAPPRSRWIHIPWNGWNEADLMSPPDASFMVFVPLIRK
jgi:hypothetical protein